MASNPIPHKWTVEEYLAYELEADIRHEYLDGEIYAMSGGTDNHSVMTANTTIAIGRQLDDSNCLIRSSDMRIKISDTKYVYPELSVVCGDPHYDNDNPTILINPIVVVEITSPSSISYDRITKRDFYCGLPSVQGYLILDQHRIFAELYTRHKTDWLLRQFMDIDDSVPLDMLNCTLPLKQVYRGIVFDDSQ